MMLSIVHRPTTQIATRQRLQVQRQRLTSPSLLLSSQDSNENGCINITVPVARSAATPVDLIRRRRRRHRHRHRRRRRLLASIRAIIMVSIENNRLHRINNSIDINEIEENW